MGAERTGSMAKKISIDHLETPYGLNDDSTCNSHDTFEDYSRNLEHYAKLATDFEHNLTVWQAVSYYKRAILWSLCFSTGIIMEAFDSSLIVSFFGYPSFTKRFGTQLPNGTYEISSQWQLLLGGSPFIGLFIGTMINGVLTEKFGHRTVVMGSLILMTGFIFISYYATSIETLMVGQILCGIPWGVFATIGPTYSSEVCPTALRGYLTSYVNMCWALGQCLAAAILSLLVKNESEWGYRIPLAIQWVWPAPLFILTYLAPESPYWLVRNDRIEEALDSIKKLTSEEVHSKAPWILSMIIHTNNMEKHLKQPNSVSDPLLSSRESRSSWDSTMDPESLGLDSRVRSDSMSDANTKLIRHSISDPTILSSLVKDSDRFGLKSYMECFKSINLRRTEISCLTMLGQTLCGIMLCYSPSYFFRQIDINATVAYQLNLLATIFAILGTLGSWLLLNKYGRRTIYLNGLNILSICLLIIGFLESFSDSVPSAKWLQCFFTMIWVFCYSLSIGPLTFTIVAEISSTNLRSQTMAIARGSYNVLQVLCILAEVQLINPEKLDLKGYAGLVWFIPCSLILLWAFFRLPETKQRTYGELDILFERRVPARKFSAYEIDRIDPS